MDTANIVEKIKLRPGMDTASDELLQDLVDDAVCRVADYIHCAEVPPDLAGAVKEMVLIQYNQMGDEGLASVSRGGVSQSYFDGLPQGLVSQLNHYRKLPNGG